MRSNLIKYIKIPTDLLRELGQEVVKAHGCWKYGVVHLHARASRVCCFIAGEKRGQRRFCPRLECRITTQPKVPVTVAAVAAVVAARSSRSDASSCTIRAASSANCCRVTIKSATIGSLWAFCFEV